MQLKQLSHREMPREKLLDNGPATLSVVELIAILMRTGIKGEDVLTFSASLLERWGGLEGLCRADTTELMQEKGLKASKVATLAAVIELGKRIALLNKEGRPLWKTRIESIALDTRFADREFIFALFIDAGDRVIKEEVLSYGGQSGAFMDIRVFYRQAFPLIAVPVVFSNIHPEGRLTASSEDIVLTNNVRRGLETLGIRLKGHYIAADGSLTQVP